MLILLCYARRRGLGLSVSMTDVRLLINGSTYGGYLNKQLGGLRHLENPVLPVFLDIPEYPCDHPMDRHPDSKGS